MVAPIADRTGHGRSPLRCWPAGFAWGSAAAPWCTNTVQPQPTPEVLWSPTPRTDLARVVLDSAHEYIRLRIVIAAR